MGRRQTALATNERDAVQVLRCGSLTTWGGHSLELSSMTSGLPLAPTTEINGKCPDTSGSHSRHQKNADDGWVIPKKATKGAKEHTQEEKSDDSRMSCGRIRDVLHRVGIDTGHRNYCPIRCRGWGS